MADQKNPQAAAPQAQKPAAPTAQPKAEAPKSTAVPNNPPQGTGTGNGEQQVVRAGNLAEIPLRLVRENQVALRPVDKENIEYQMLVDSIRNRGIMNPITVREFVDPDPRANGRKLYGIIDGLQRYNASLDAGKQTIPAHIMDMNQAEIEEAQIIANAVRIETKPIQYTRQLERMLIRNPLMTIKELSSRLSRPEKWLYDRFNIIKKFSPELQKLVDDNKMKLSNAIQLAKLPEDEIPNWVDRAISMDVNQFTPAVTGRIKELKDARAQGRAPKAEQFQPTIHSRPFGEVKNEFLSNVTGPQLLTKHNVTEPLAAWKLALAWVCSMDPDSQVEQKRQHEERETAAKTEKERKKREREDAKNKEAAMIAASLAPDTKFVEKTPEGGVAVK